MTTGHLSFPYRKPQTTSSVRSVLWRKPTHWLSWKRYSTRHFCCLPDIWMQPQVWRFQAVAVVLIQVAGDGTKTKMNLNGHAVVREWQTKCASAGKGFTDNFSTQDQKT